MRFASLLLCQCDVPHVLLFSVLLCECSFGWTVALKPKITVDGKELQATGNVNITVKNSKPKADKKKKKVSFELVCFVNASLIVLCLRVQKGSDDDEEEEGGDE